MKTRRPVRGRGALAALALALAFLLPADRARADSPATNVSFIPQIARITGAPSSAIGQLNAVRMGDVTGDGIDDLVLGAKYTAGPDGSRSFAGAVMVVFGPFAGDRDLALAPPEFIAHGAAADHFTGYSVWVADLNEDGVDDVAFGATGTRRPDTSDSVRGQACIFFGPITAATLDLAVTEPDLCITGFDRGDQFGGNIITTDWTGDGHVDLVVAAETGSLVPTISPGGGTVAVIEGPFAPGPIRHLSPSSPPYFMARGAGGASDFARALAVGDLNGDGREDLAIGIPDQPLPGRPLGCGQAAVLFAGRPPGMMDFAVTAPDVVVGGLATNERLGRSVAVGDLSGDGVADLVVGAIGFPHDHFEYSGKVHVILGPLAAGTDIDQDTTFADVEMVHGELSGFGNSAAFMPAPAGQPSKVLIGGGYLGPLWCGCSSGAAFVLDALTTSPSPVDLNVDLPALTIASSLEEGLATNVAWVDVDDDGVHDPVVSGEAKRCPPDLITLCGTVIMVKTNDRCLEPPSALAPGSLRVRRDGDDVEVAFDTAGVGVSSASVDVYRGTIARFRRMDPYDHGAISGGCSLDASPFVDPGMAAAGADDVYYVATLGCPSACLDRRLVGELGNGTLGPRPLPRRPADDICP